MQKLLVTGKHGQVGSALVRLAASQYEVVAVDVDELDLTDLPAVDALVREVKPDWLINPAAYTAVDAAESDASTAQILNEAAPQVMARACADLDVPMVHYSTDYVFNGRGSRPYLETDAPDPQSVYGRTKLAGEQAVLAAQPNSIILRTAWVYARNGRNFVNTLLGLVGMREEFNVVNDQIGSPTLAEDLAAATLQIIAQTPVSSVPKVAGVYHATGTGHTSWANFASEIFRLSGSDKIKVNAISSEDYIEKILKGQAPPAPRPAYSVLDNNKLEATFGVTLPHWRSALARTLQV